VKDKSEIDYSMPTGDVVFDTDQLARFLNIDKHTIYRWRESREMPVGHKVSTKKIIWLKSEIIEWIKSH
jgi:predicted DNA-binding transcriptional regulator AlpA